MTKEEIIDMARESEALMVDGFDDCIIGLASRCGLGPVLLYNEERIVEKIMKDDECSYDEAREYYEFNILGSYVGDETPLFALMIDESTEVPIGDRPEDIQDVSEASEEI